jgi:putative membrane protein
LGVLVALGLTVSSAMSDALSKKEEFVRKTEMSNEFELGANRLARDKSPTPSVKKFAKMMIDDHAAALKNLERATVEAGLEPEQAPALEPRYMKEMEKLELAKISEFDRLYLDVQRRTHEEAIALYDDYARNGDSAPLKKYAQETLPMLREHLGRLKALADTT